MRRKVVNVTKPSVVQESRIVGNSLVHRILMAVLMFLFWLLLSGNLEVKFLIYGALTAIIVSWITYPLLLVPNQDRTKQYFLFAIHPLKLFWYFLWLMWQLLLANIEVIRSTVRTDLTINPRVCRFRFVADNPLATVILANSITLTPGTVTMNVTEDGVFEVHALTDGSAEGLMDGSMQGEVAWLMGEDYRFEVMGEDF